MRVMEDAAAEERVRRDENEGGGRDRAWYARTCSLDRVAMSGVSPPHSNRYPLPLVQTARELVSEGRACTAALLPVGIEEAVNGIVGKVVLGRFAALFICELLIRLPW